MQLQVSPTAVVQIKKMLAKNGHGKGLRLKVKDTGCSGKSYDLSIIDQVAADDQLLPLAENLILAVDPQSYEFVKGTTMDYVREGLNHKFVFTNPQSKGTCGCGESFYV